MFKFQYLREPFSWTVLTTWLGNGSNLVVSNLAVTYSGCKYVIDGSIFKMQFSQPKPTGLAADNDNRVLSGYQSATMEWSYDGVTYRSDVVPIVKEEAHSIFVRYKETAYSTDNAEYGNYKKYLASEPTEVVFDANFYPSVPVLIKTSLKLPPPSPDGFVRVGDTVQFTITAKNEGNVKSNWTNVIVTDIMPTGLTFGGNVTIDGVSQNVGVGYTFIGTTLTVPLNNIPGGGQKVITFEATVNQSAAGTTIMNHIRAAGKDGNTGTDVIIETDDNGGDGLPIKPISAPPAIDTITEGDLTISGDGVNGASVVVTLPGGVVLPAVTVTGGRWTVPASVVNLVAGNIVSAVQTEPGKDPSPAAQTTVIDRPPFRDVGNKTARNLTDRPDGSRRVGDVLEYTITVSNTGEPKSLWVNADIVDILPPEVDFVPNSVRIDNALPGAGTTVDYNAGTHTLIIIFDGIPGGVTRVVVFNVTINDTAYGKVFQNVAKINGKDTPEPPKPPTPGRTPKPLVDEINEGDRIVTGQGEPGARIEVNFPDSTIVGIATVQPDRTWSVNVPTSMILQEGKVVAVVQIQAPEDPSEPVNEVVQGKKPVLPYVTKTAQNLTSSDGKTRVGDTIQYTIIVGNSGSPKSYWTGAYLKDYIPVGLTLDFSTIRIDGETPAYAHYYTDTRLLDVWVYRSKMVGGDNGIQGGTFVTVTLKVTVDANTYGEHIMNSVSIEGKDNGGDDLDKDADEDGGGYTVVGKSEKPVIDEVVRDDPQITGEGEPGATIVVTLDDGGPPLTATVGSNRRWSVNVPSNRLPQTGDVITAVQIEPDMDPSDPVKQPVVDKNYRAVHGYVWPMVTDDLELGDSFLRKHDIIVELRPKYYLPAAAGLSVASVLVDPNSEDGLGEFTIPNVPFDDYVLVIRRPGYLVRCMNITISASDPDMIELVPPSTDPRDLMPFNNSVINQTMRIFRLWWGDCTDNLRIESLDVMMITELTNVNARSDKYNPACDLNADGQINSLDVMMVVENTNKFARQYAGANNVDFGD